jgi:peptide/nickel transport system substrate-binding protein
MITRTRVPWILLSLLVIIGIIAAACGEASTPTPEPATVAAVPETEETTPDAPVATTTAPDAESSPESATDVSTPASVIAPEIGEMPVCLSPEDNPVHGGTLRVTSYEPASYDAGGALDSYAAASSQSFTHLTLATWHICDWRDTLDFTPYPYLAESWDVSEDGLSYTFHLRKGVKWENRPPLNGREVTAHDVVFSFNHHMENSPNLGLLGPLSSVRAIDDYTVVFTTDAVYVPFMTYMAHPYFPIYAPEVLEEFGSFDSVESSIGAGPWRLIEHQSGVKQVFVRNPDYFRGPNGITGEELPYIERVESFFVTDDATKLAMYRGHEIDVGPAFYYWGHWSGDNDVYEALKGTDPALVEDFRSFSTSPFPLWRMQAKVDRPPFNNEKLRQAVSRVIDRTFTPWAGTWGVVEAREFNFDYSMFLPWENLTELGRANYPRDAADNPIRDIASARALVNEVKEEMGLSPDEKIDGGTIYTHNLADYFAGIAELIKAWLDEIDIETEIVVLDYTEWNSSIVLPPFDWCCIQWSYGFAGLDPDNYFYRNFHPNGDDNRTGIDDPHLTSLIEAQRSEFGSEARLEIMYDIQRYLAEKQYEWRVPNFLGQNIYPPWLKNVAGQKASSTQGYSFMWAWLTEEAPGR